MFWLSCNSYNSSTRDLFWKLILVASAQFLVELATSESQFRALCSNNAVPLRSSDPHLLQIQSQIKATRNISEALLRSGNTNTVYHQYGFARYFLHKDHRLSPQSTSSHSSFYLHPPPLQSPSEGLGNLREWVGSLEAVSDGATTRCLWSFTNPEGGSVSALWSSFLEQGDNKFTFLRG